jgi:hypothetical protein
MFSKLGEFMKKQIAMTLGLAILSVPAMASKARLEALGQSANGSQFLGDDRSIFINPAELNNYRDFITFEWGDTGNESDSAASPRAEGGVIRSSGNMVYGVYFGDESSSSSQLRKIGTGNTTDSSEEMNSSTLFIGGDAGMQWGLSLNHQAYESKQTASTTDKASALGAKIGIISGDIEFFSHIGLGNTAEYGSNEYEEKTNYAAGLNYNLGDMTAMLYTSSNEGEAKTSGNKIKASATKLGVAKTYKLNDKATMWASAWYSMSKAKCDTAFTAACADSAGTAQKENNITNLPVSFGLEVAAKEWLTLRGSVGQDFFISEHDNGSDKSTRKNTTIVATGASLIFGDLTIDGMIGNDTKAATGTESTASGGGRLFSDGAMSRVSMTYKF